mmetsp:Transcript_20507/g.52686  ORF Transcript_20507/g.52686 Transcript_20507/m.52686 type:complete len:701 (-) Transcript_20507:753-2855(-)
MEGGTSQGVKSRTSSSAPQWAKKLASRNSQTRIAPATRVSRDSLGGANNKTLKERRSQTPTIVGGNYGKVEGPKSAQRGGSIMGTGTRPATAAVQEDEENSDTTELQKERRQTLNEMIVYVVFVSLFTIIIFLSRNNTMSFEYTQTLRDNLQIGNLFQGSVASIDTFWDYTEDVIVPLFATDALSNDSTFSYYQEGIFVHGNKLMGNISMRQLRVNGQPCRDVPGYDPSRSCFPEFKDSLSEKVFLKGDDSSPKQQSYPSAYVYQNASDLGEVRVAFQGGFSNYPGGGFIITLANEEDAKVKVLSLQAEKWVDMKTRAVFFDMVFYNDNLNMFCAVRLLFEFLPTGSVRPNPQFRTFVLNRYQWSSIRDYVVAILEFILVAFILKYIVEEIVEIAKGGIKPYLKQFWNFVDWTNLIVFGVVIGMRLRTTLEVIGFIADPSLFEAANLQTLGWYFDQEQTLNGVNALICWLKVFKYLKITRRMTQLSRTITKAIIDIAIFACVLLLFVLGYGVFGFMVFGTDNPEYMTMTVSIQTLFRAIFGDFDARAISQNDSLLGPIYLFSWIMIAVALLLNMFIAILTEAYMQVHNEDKERGSEVTIFDDIKKAMKKRYNALLKRNEEQIHAIQELKNRLEYGDEDNDGVLTRDELEKVVKDIDPQLLEGYTVDDLMQEVDMDGDNVLDATELARFRVRTMLIPATCP